MPELPEVETVRRGLAAVVGATVTSVTVLRDSCVRRMPGGAAEFSAALTGRRLRAVARRGKYLWMPLDDDFALSAHLGMSGQFRVYDADVEPHRHTRVRLGLDVAGSERILDFVDQRTFGYLATEAMIDTDDGKPGGEGSPWAVLPASVAHVARDPLDPSFDAAAAARALRRGKRRIKSVLLDQTVISGIGNIYADETLWRAQVHPQRPVDRLAAPDAVRVIEQCQAVMSDALAAGGTSFDALYVNVNGESGYFARHLDVYGAAGEPCQRCGSVIMRDVFGGRSAHWCPRCQRAPRRN